MPAEKVIFTSYRKSLNIKNLGNIKTELEKGLSHIKEALRLAEISTYATSCMSSVSVAEDLIQGFLNTVVTMSAISTDPCNYINERYIEGNAGWNPMRSKFPSISTYDEQNYKYEKETHQDNVGYNLTAFFQEPNSQTKQMLKEGNMEFPLCGVNCNSQSQCEPYINGHCHKRMNENEHFSQKMIKSYHPINNVGIYRKRTHKLGGLYPKNLQKVENRFGDVGCWMMKDSEIEKRKSNVKRQQRKSNEMRQHVSSTRWEICDIAWRCEMCDVTCNGKLQYISHINGKRHKMVPE